MSPARAVRTYDAVVIGGGHNGLVAACYLTGAGLSVAVLERASVVGGAAVTETLAPGFRLSTASYVLSLMPRRILDELDRDDRPKMFAERVAGHGSGSPLRSGRESCHPTRCGTSVSADGVPTLHGCRHRTGARRLDRVRADGVTGPAPASRLSG